jgi:hypothetical protein
MVAVYNRTHNHTGKMSLKQEERAKDSQVPAVPLATFAADLAGLIQSLLTGLAGPSNPRLENKNAGTTDTW